MQGSLVIWRSRHLTMMGYWMAGWLWLHWFIGRQDKVCKRLSVRSRLRLLSGLFMTVYSLRGMVLNLRSANRLRTGLRHLQFSIYCHCQRTTVWKKLRNFWNQYLRNPLGESQETGLSPSPTKHRESSVDWRIWQPLVISTHSCSSYSSSRSSVNSF